MHPRRSFLLMGVALALSATLPSLAGDAVRTQELFFIQRSKNANEVHYDARVAKDGRLDPDQPVVGYWLNKAEDGSRKPIKLVQQIAYGFDVAPSKDGATYGLKLKAFKERPMTIVRSDKDGRWRVQTTIAGKPAFMNRIYVATDESSLMPTVLYVDVYGEETGSGAPVHEHIAR